MSLLHKQNNTSFLHQIRTKITETNHINQLLIAKIASQMQQRKKDDDHNKQKRQEIVRSLSEMRKFTSEMKEECQKSYKTMFDDFFVQTIRIMRMYQSKIIKLQKELFNYKSKQSMQMSINMQTQRSNFNISNTQMPTSLHSLRESIDQFSQIKPKKIKICDIIASYKSNFNQDDQDTNLSIFYKNEEIPQLFDVNNSIKIDNPINILEQFSKYNYSKLHNYQSVQIQTNQTNQPIYHTKINDDFNIIQIDQLKTQLQNVAYSVCQSKMKKGKQNQGETMLQFKKKTNKKRQKDMQELNANLLMMNGGQNKIFQSKITQLRKNMLSRHKKR